MTKYSYEQRLETVQNVTEKHMSIGQAAKLLGTAEEHVHRWVKRYEAFGKEGLLLKNGSYTGDFKLNVIEYMYANHLSISETTVIFAIPTDVTVWEWVQIYDEKDPQALFRENRGRKKSMNTKPKVTKPNKQTEDDLVAKVQRLRMEVDYLKKLNALIQEKEKSAAKKKQ